MEWGRSDTVGGCEEAVSISKALITATAKRFPDHKRGQKRAPSSACEPQALGQVRRAVTEWQAFLMALGRSPPVSTVGPAQMPTAQSFMLAA